MAKKHKEPLCCLVKTAAVCCFCLQRFCKEHLTTIKGNHAAKPCDPTRRRKGCYNPHWVASPEDLSSFIEGFKREIK